MGRHHFNLKRVLEIALISTICLNVTAASYEQPGFVSIDCGSTKNRYTDDIGLIWVNDGTNISTGANSGRAFNVTSNYANYRALEDFRYFPENRSKHCYDLRTKTNTTYLIRPMFYYNSSESKLLDLPIEFDVFLNSSPWFTVKYDDQTFYSNWEGIFHSLGSVIYVCLQAVIGTPFISSLELRPLDPDGIMYSSAVKERKYLSIRRRRNYGFSNATVRFPDDAFDRLWRPHLNMDDVIVAPDSLLANANTSTHTNNVPMTVMLDAEQFSYPSTTNISLADWTLPVDTVYVVVYFQDLNGFESGEWIIGINDGDKDIYTSSPFTITDKPSMQVVSNLALGTRNIGLSFYPTNSTFNDNDPPTITINAVEVFSEDTFQDSSSDPSERKALEALHKSFNLIDWQGDPCTPVPNYWLTCLQVHSHWSVESITLSNLRSGGWHSLMNKYYSDEFSSLYLEEMTLTNSQIDNVALKFLIGNFTAIGKSSSLTTLDLSYNLINNTPPAIYWQNAKFLKSLNLSHNALHGELFFSVDMPFIGSLKVLNLSHNTITSLRTEWARSNVTTSLVVLDVSHNKLVGEVSSLNKLVNQSWETLEEIYVSNNNLTGIFPSDLYFANLSSLLVANFDANLIQGTLDLGAWHESLQQAMNTSKAPTTGQLFSFVNNSIEHINPSAKVLESTIATFLKSNNYPNFNQTGVMLGGNPYCKGVKSEIQRYLCRFTINDNYIVQEKNNKKLIMMIVGIIGGVFVLLVCGVLLATVWNLWVKVSILRQIQQALADQQVQPPFYSYNDLKFATRDFHKDNKLGSGAFGVVYKGMLVDGTTLAIKKLFNSQQVQVLNEFLNEVVLITGIKHKNLVQLKGCCITDKQRILVYEYAEKGNLAEALWGREAHEISILDWQQRFNICVGVARGLSYLHEELQQRIIHRDIKPANILLDNNLNPQIADFGLAKHYLDEQSQAQFTNIAGTQGYFAPEYASQGKLTEKADVYSFGILVLEIVSGRKVINHNLPSERIYLKDWAQKLHQDGMSLEILQPELRKNCIEADVIRVINIALICVQMQSERRATMSQVVTMFLGNMDVTIFLDMDKYHQLDFNIIHPTCDGQKVMSVSKIHNNSKSAIIEESHQIEYPLLRALQTNSNTSVAIAEPSNMMGR